MVLEICFEGEVFEKQIIEEKYKKEEVGCHSCKARDGYSVKRVWKAIRKG